MDAYLSVARAWLDRGEPARARACLAPLVGAARRSAWLPMLALASLVDGRAAAALGDHTVAKELLGEAAELG